MKLSWKNRREVQKRNPKVTICIPAYNQEILTRKALESIPERDDIEVIVVDDNSTDSTLQTVLSFWQGTSLDMRVVHRIENGGISNAYNRAYDMAQGEYIYQLDCDDYLFTDRFERAMEQLDGTDIVYVAAETNDGTILMPSEGNHNLCAGWFKFIRRDFMKDIRRPINAYGGDYEMNLEMISRPHSSKYTELCVYHYNYPREGSVIWELTHK